MRITFVTLALMLCSLGFCKETPEKSISKKSIAMKQKKQRASLASIVPIDRPTPMTSDARTEGAYEGMGTIGNVSGVLK